MPEARARLRHKGRKLCPEHEKQAPWRGWWTDTQTSVSSYNLQPVPRHQRTPTGSHRAREPTGAVHVGSPFPPRPHTTHRGEEWAVGSVQPKGMEEAKGREAKNMLESKKGILGLSLSIHPIPLFSLKSRK